MGSLISVVVPIYNAEKFLKKCIESILIQTHKNLEIILINDGSIDNSLSICNSYKEKDSRIIVIDKINEGVSRARNTGIKIAKGDYIAFVDSDDYIDEYMYEKLLKIIKEDKSEICAMTVHTINKFEEFELSSARGILTREKSLEYLFLLKFPTSLWSYLYSKKAIENIFLDEEIDFFEDFEFNFRAIMKSKKISLCNEKFYNYNNNEESINNQKINMKRLTCLNIQNKVEGSLEDRYKRYFIFTKAHFIISIIASISKSPICDEIYYSKSHSYTKKNIREIIISTYVPLAYKILIFIYLISPHMLCRLLYNLKYRV